MKNCRIICGKIIVVFFKKEEIGSKNKPVSIRLFAYYSRLTVQRKNSGSLAVRYTSDPDYFYKNPKVFHYPFFKANRSVLYQKNLCNKESLADNEAWFVTMEFCFSGR